MRTFLFFFIIMLLSCKEDKKTNTEFEDKYKPMADSSFVIKPITDSIEALTKEGNIVFRGGTDAESNIIRDFSYKDKLFSHCGIALNTDSGIVVAHMLGGTDNPNGGILFQKIKNFLKYPENESAGVYEINISKPEIDKFHQYADSIKNKKVGFDLKFDLFTKNVLYCTEMLADGLSLVKNKKDFITPIAFNLKNTKYFFLANSKDSFLFYPIDKFQHNKLLTEKKIFYFPNFGRNIISF